MTWTNPATAVAGTTALAAFVNTNYGENLKVTQHKILTNTANVGVFNTTVETNLHAHAIPANTLGISGILRFNAFLRSDTDQVGVTQTARVYFGGVLIYQFATTPSQFEQRNFNVATTIYADAATNVQRSFTVTDFNTRDDPTAASDQVRAAFKESLAVNSTVSQELKITWQNSAAGGAVGAEIFVSIVEAVGS